MTQKFYAGVGSRQTPESVCRLMTKLSTRLEQDGYILRSGNAVGADRAFEQGCTQKEIFIAQNEIPSWAYQSVNKHHPTPQRLSRYARKLHARNAMIMLGGEGDNPVDFLVCWTPDAKVTGGTAQAIRIAYDYDIPVRNLARSKTMIDCLRYIENL